MYFSHPKTRHPYNLPKDNRIMKTNEFSSIAVRYKQSVKAYQNRLIYLGGLKLTGFGGIPLFKFILKN